MSRLPHLLSFALLGALLPSVAPAQDAPLPPAPHFSRFAAGDGPRMATGGEIRLLDAAGSKSQSNAVAFDGDAEGARESLSLRANLRVGKGGDGGAFVFLNTAEYGARGPAPFVRSWVEPNLTGTFAVGIDVHNPKNEEMFGEWGNYQGLPEREISLHFDGRELVKRVAPEEFRGEWSEILIDVEHVVGGAEVSVRIAGAFVYERFFIPNLLPYASRLAIGAGTRADAVTTFDVRGVEFMPGPAAAPRRPPVHVEVFNHVLTDNSKQSFEKEVDLPPALFAFGRVILTLEIHDAGPDWDEWDRNGHLAVIDEDGFEWDIVPFITSYRTECHWEVDISHYRSLLTGKRRFKITAGTNFYKGRGYMMSVSLDFHHGTPKLEPFAVVPLWHGTAKYKSAENHFSDFFEPHEVAIPAETAAAAIVTTTTGHSQIGEFTPSVRTVTFEPRAGAGGAKSFENMLWKNDCYLNPNRPQFGTWKFSRAGWAPGDIVWPWWIDLTDHVVPGATARIDYEPHPYDFEGMESAPNDKQINGASHVIRSSLVLYRKPQGLIAAPTLLVTGVANESNAAKAGVVRGDYLASYDGVIVDSIDALSAAKKAALDAGKERVAAVIYRGADRIEIELATGQLGVNLGSR
jgi:hypothetical protein